jgi:protein kinase A
MIVGHPPFVEDDPFRLYEKILVGRYTCPQWMDPLAKDLISRLLTSDLSRRYGNLRDGALDVKFHPWFASIDWNALWRLEIAAPYIPTIRSEGDTSHFDDYDEDYGGYGASVENLYGDSFRDF